MKTPVITSLALLVFAAAPAAHAQDGTAYYGLAIGEFDYEDNFFNGFEGFSDSVSTWHLQVGYQFLEHLAVEGAYGESKTIRDTNILLGDQVSYETGLDRILTIRLLGVLPFGKSGFSVMGGLGYADIKQDIDIAVNGQPILHGDVSANNPVYFLGAQYDFERLALRLGYEKYDFDGDVDAAETSLTFFYKL
jgi:outer membrane protein with beta-barrel domain